MHHPPALGQGALPVSHIVVCMCRKLGQGQEGSSASTGAAPAWSQRSRVSWQSALKACVSEDTSASQRPQPCECSPRGLRLPPYLQGGPQTGHQKLQRVILQPPRTQNMKQVGHLKKAQCCRKSRALSSREHDTRAGRLVRCGQGQQRQQGAAPAAKLPWAVLQGPAVCFRLGPAAPDSRQILQLIGKVSRSLQRSWDSSDPQTALPGHWGRDPIATATKSTSSLGHSLSGAANESQRAPQYSDKQLTGGQCSS